MSIRRGPRRQPGTDPRSLDLEAAYGRRVAPVRSEEHTSELQSLMRISYAVFCLKKKKNTNTKQYKLIDNIQEFINTAYPIYNNNDTMKQTKISSLKTKI